MGSGTKVRRVVDANAATGPRAGLAQLGTGRDIGSVSIVTTIGRCHAVFITVPTQRDIGIVGIITIIGCGYAMG